MIKRNPDGDGINPWIDFRAKTMDILLQMRDDSTKQFNYIILENLTSKFKYPCIMDLKLGTRTYSDDMSEEKKQVHLKKCDTTTSKPLGIRLAGLQVFHSSDSRYHYIDKYDGSALSSDKLVETLTDFLHNGRCHNTKVVPQLIEKLKQLRDVIRRLDSYRFFSSSLLIMYEGGEDNVAMATSSFPAHCSNGQPIENQPPFSSNHPSMDLIENSSSNSDHPLNGVSSSCGSGLCGSGYLVDVRMIDFGNVTSNCYTTDPILYDGPDGGYIFGLTNIINVYEDFLKNQ